MKLRFLVGAVALTLPAFASAAPVAGIEWNGFGSAYVAKSMAKNARPLVINDDNVDAAGLSLLGLNLKAQVDNDVTASAQIIARMRDESRGDLNAKWFYLTYTPMADLHVKGGRQNLPLFMNSEMADVHAALPYTRIPDELTAMAPFRSFDGVSVDHTYRFSNDLAVSVAAEGGRTVYAPGEDEQRYGHDFAGANLGLGGGWWQVSLHASRMGFTPSSTMMESSLANYTAGIKLERWNILAQAEGLHQETNKGNGDGGYALVGYKWNGWMPRYSYNWARAKALNQGETITHDIGVNYQIGQRLIAKVDVQLSKISGPRGGIGFMSDDQNRTSATAALAGVDFLF